MIFSLDSHSMVNSVFLRGEQAAFPWSCIPLTPSPSCFLTGLLWESHHSSWAGFRDGKETSFPMGLYPTSEEFVGGRVVKVTSTFHRSNSNAGNHVSPFL